MTVFDWTQETLDSFSQTDFFKQGCGISTGSFDGLHLGHRFLLNKLVEECKSQGLASGVITFKRPLPALKMTLSPSFAPIFSSSSSTPIFLK